MANGGVPVYAIVRPYNDAWKTTDVVYHTFYPYNRGKDVCLGYHPHSRSRTFALRIQLKIQISETVLPSPTN